jgi:hypothetical protein
MAGGEQGEEALAGPVPSEVRLRPPLGFLTQTVAARHERIGVIDEAVDLGSDFAR